MLIDSCRDFIAGKATANAVLAVLMLDSRASRIIDSVARKQGLDQKAEDLRQEVNEVFYFKYLSTPGLLTDPSGAYSLLYKIAETTGKSLYRDEWRYSTSLDSMGLTHREPSQMHNKDVDRTLEFVESLAAISDVDMIVADHADTVIEEVRTEKFAQQFEALFIQANGRSSYDLTPMKISQQPQAMPGIIPVGLPQGQTFPDSSAEAAAGPDVGNQEGDDVSIGFSTKNLLHATHIELKQLVAMSGLTHDQFAKELVISETRLNAYLYGRTSTVPEDVLADARNIVKSRLTARDRETLDMPMAQLMDEWFTKLNLKPRDFNGLARLAGRHAATLRRWYREVMRPELDTIREIDSRINVLVKKAR